MPYTAQHKQRTRERIVDCARRLFNRKGLNDVSIDEIMAAAGLTRGGFYNHFSSKDELYVAAIDSYGTTNPAQHWENIELDMSAAGAQLITQMINAYLSQDHLADVECQCPMTALPSDVARAGPEVKAAYERSLRALAEVFASHPPEVPSNQRQLRSLSTVALCVGGMVLARTIEDKALADDILESCRTAALEGAGV